MKIPSALIFVAVVSLLFWFAMPASSATVDENTAAICSYHPDADICAVIEPPVIIDPPVIVDPPTTDGWVWQEVPNSAMNTVYIKDVDNSPEMVAAGAWNSFAAVQNAESGGVCFNDNLYVTGGGHADGANNGIYAVNPTTGVWSRYQEPSPFYGNDDPRCPANDCSAGPDGKPAAKHTYNLLTSDDKYIYLVGGSTWKKGNSGTGIKSWKLDVATGEWSGFAESPITKPNGSLQSIGDKLYLVTGRGYAIYDKATDTWERPSRLSGFNNKRVVQYEPISKTFLAVGLGRVMTFSLENFGIETTLLTDAPQHLKDSFNAGTTTKDGLILIWNDGATVDTWNPVTGEWGVIEATGSAPSRVKNGTFGRFSNCGGELVIVSGIGSNMRKLVQGDYVPPVIVDPRVLRGTPR